MKVQFRFHAVLAAIVIGTSAAPGASGDVDPAFNPDVWSQNERPVFGMALQPDGKILISGGFTNVNGVARRNVLRLDGDGVPDPSFSVTTNVAGPQFGTGLMCAAVQDDGRILVGGWFTNFNGHSSRSLVRLHADGTVDGAFLADIDGPAYPVVQHVSFLPDGKLFVAGRFTTVNGVAQTNFARLNPDGSRAGGFNLGCNGTILSAAVLPGGRRLIGGAFTHVGSVPRKSLARLNEDGSLDMDFAPNILDYYDPAVIYAIAVQPDGKILIGGSMTNVGGFPRAHIARLQPDGSVDESFNPDAEKDILSFALQADGRILVAGWFLTIGGVPRAILARLNANGSLDDTFLPSPNNEVDSLALQADGQVLAGGWFTNMSSVPRRGLARLTNEPATQLLSVPDAERVQWLRGGSSPEAAQVSFDLSTNAGASWMPLGWGARVAGGWELAGLDLPASGLVRARARVWSGFCNGSSSLFETIVPFTGLITRPRLAGPTRLPDGSMRFTFTHQAGLSFTALATTNLMLPASNWNVLGPVTEQAPGQFQFTDTAATHFDFRFYRVRSP